MRYLVTGPAALDQVRATLLFPGTTDKSVGALPGLEAEQAVEELDAVPAVVVDVVVGVGLDSKTLTLVPTDVFAKTDTVKAFSKTKKQKAPKVIFGILKMFFMTKYH
jgi:hypothetical protein